jgi:hypothetical protein
VAELARAIAVERVAWTDGDETVVCSRLERLLRVLFTMACDGDLRAVRCALEYLEGRPVQLVAAEVVRDVERPLTADAMAGVLAEALARVEAWRLSGGVEQPALEAGKMRLNG